MKKFLSILFSLLFGSISQADDLKYEASMNFDLENIKPFLTDLNHQFKLSLDVDTLVKFTSSVLIETEKTKLVDITINGAIQKMTYSIFMDDFDAPDLYLFFKSQEMAENIRHFMIEWAEERGM